MSILHSDRHNRRVRKQRKRKKVESGIETALQREKRQQRECAKRDRVWCRILRAYKEAT